MLKLEELQPIMDKILERKDELATMPPQHHSINDTTAMKELTPFRVKLIEVYAKSITTPPVESKEAINSWGTEISDLLVNLDLPLDVGLSEITYYRNVIGEIVRDEAIRQDMSLNEFYNIITEFNIVMDYAVQIVSRSYKRDFNKAIESAKTAVDELSVPVVQLTKDIGLVPIVGEIDTNRSQYLMSNALERSLEMDLNLLILDVSGVSIIDTMVAAQIFKVMISLNLTGVESVLSGVRPEVAQTMVNLGIQVPSRVYSNLRAAIEDNIG